MGAMTGRNRVVLVGEGVTRSQKQARTKQAQIVQATLRHICTNFKKGRRKRGKNEQIQLCAYVFNSTNPRTLRGRDMVAS
ncbi:hypothetical protein KIN20_027536 [Parelaphostrongylus tenuis]|uniref:Uncharacterized protein n=1 Tax=Parelaphostrongylus tenuis TaxID=148309 RepID=A0AAD5QZQ5_PARTN|nr:hypothetical protein KIN20_027536 [Parelaphostrongylus tenuis]